VKYMLLIYNEEHPWESKTEDERQEIYAEYRTLIGTLAQDGKYVGGAQLQPVTTATTVRVQNGKALFTDGPFAETKEALGGYFLIDAATLDEALDIAGRIPSAREGSIEVRPVVERDE
jgi:hypothetical protein